MMVYLPQNLGFLAKAVSHPHRTTRWGATTGIRVTSKDGLYICDATDGRRLVSVNGGNLDKDWPVVEDCPEWEGEVIVPTAAWADIFRLARGTPKKWPAPVAH